MESEEFLNQKEKALKESLKIVQEMKTDMVMISIPKKNEENIQSAKQEICLCYDSIIDFLGEWIDIPDEHKKIISLWIIGTYFHKSFSTYPYLFFNAMRGSGKTRLLSIISWLQFNGNGSILNNPSEPVMFRTASERGLIIDEFESEKSKEKQTMREYLNSCYKKGGEVFRMEKQKIDGKEKLVPIGYKLFTPVAMANINGIEDVLADRSISLILEKSSNPALVKKIEDFDTNKIIREIKRTLNLNHVELCSVELLQESRDGWNVYINNKYSTSLHTIHTIHNSTTKHQIELDEFYSKIDSTGIFGRNLELFFPLLITAKMLSNSIFEEMLVIVSKLNSIKKEDEYAESKEVSLIEFVSKCEKYRFEYVFVKQLLQEFQEYIGSQNVEDERWINITWLGLTLKKLKLIHDRKRVVKGQLVHLNVDKAKEKLLMFKEGENK